jgi:hypothetical protein
MSEGPRKRRIHKSALAKRTIGEMLIVAIVMVMAAGTIVALAAIAWGR